MIYVDYNASTPIAPQVREAMLPFLAEHYGNPSSGHWAGVPAAQAVASARGQLAALLGCSPGEIVFTSGGTRGEQHGAEGRRRGGRRGEAAHRDHGDRASRHRRALPVPSKGTASM